MLETPPCALHKHALQGPALLGGEEGWYGVWLERGFPRGLCDLQLLFP